MNGRSWAPTLQLDRLGTFEIAVTTMSINDGASTSTRHAVIATTSTGVDSTQATSVVYGDVPSSSKHTFVDAITSEDLEVNGETDDETDDASTEMASDSGSDAEYFTKKKPFNVRPSLSTRNVSCIVATKNKESNIACCVFLYGKLLYI